MPGDDALETARSVAAASLLRGVVYREESPRVWAALTTPRIHGLLLDFFAVLGLTVIIDEAEQFAYLRSVDEVPEGMPRLIRRHSLTYYATILLVLLRQRLAQADADAAVERVLVTHAELVEDMRTFHDPTATDDRIGNDIRAIVELGYLRRVPNSEEPTYEVRRIIKAVITGDWLARHRDTLLGVEGDETGPRPEDLGSDDATADATGASSLDSSDDDTDVGQDLVPAVEPANAAAGDAWDGA
jgi:hypothetical protein